MSEPGAGSEFAADVAIVGGGPVGLGLAIELGQRGVACVLVERYSSPQPIPKGQNLTQRTMEHFHFWGAEKALRAARTVPPEFGIGGLTAYRTLLGGYTHDWLQRELVRPFYFTDNERLPQYATEAVLRRRVAELASVRTLYGWTVETVTQDGEGVSLAIAERGGEGRGSVRAAYAVGCDGSRSTVREQAGITETRRDHDRLMVLLVFRSAGLHPLLSGFPGKCYFNIIHPDLHGYWKFFGRVDLGTTWFFHAPVPPGTTKDNFDFRRHLHEALGAEFDVEFEHIGFWELRVAIADTYRSGRIFIAGDAAHSHPPYGGYGINTGLEDAANLGWKLAATLGGWAGGRLLDSYTEERRPVFESTARDFIEKAIESDRAFVEAYDPERDRAAFERAWKGRASAAPSEVDSFEPNYGGSSVVWGRQGETCSAVGSHSFAARAGHHLAPQPLSSGRSVFDALGSGFTLLAFDADPSAVEAFEAAAAARSIPLSVVRDDRSGARARYEADLVLVRPDQFVAWAGSGTSVDAGAVLACAIGAD
ncbi:FAD-dependent monooxygenase [Propylenella binzhouense]|uniref:Monooxygenase n=1 Tax=Propylenella binzhouense TaxID=2555902 RepID=A0A964T5T8_9HYPH|nr:FAD-dependent monooxygenase [Propylenella binzhouense]MYZ48960.1 monooxygenase [Propylenella binzhouense]